MKKCPNCNSKSIVSKKGVGMRCKKCGYTNLRKPPEGPDFRVYGKGDDAR